MFLTNKWLRQENRRLIDENSDLRKRVFRLEIANETLTAALIKKNVAAEYESGKNNCRTRKVFNEAV